MNFETLLRSWNCRTARISTGLILTLILLVGAVFRFTGIDWDQGHHLHPDERFLTMVETDLKWPASATQYFDEAQSPLNPRNVGHTYFTYGTLVTTLVKGLNILTGKTERFNPANARQILGGIKWDRVARYAESGTWSKILDPERGLFDPAGFPNRAPVLTWFLVLECLALLVFPLLAPLLGGLEDNGWLVSKTLGLLLVAWGAWALSCVGPPFNGRTMGLWIFGLGAASVLSGWYHRRFLARFWCEKKALIVGEELLFLLFFLYFSSGYGSFDLWRGSRTPVADYLIIHGLFVFLILSFMLQRIRAGGHIYVLVRGLRLYVKYFKRRLRLYRLTKVLIRPVSVRIPRLIAIPLTVLIATLLFYFGQGVCGLNLILCGLTLLLWISPEGNRKIQKIRREILDVCLSERKSINI